MSDLTQQSCKACEGFIAPMSKAQIQQQLEQLEGWVASEDHQSMTRDFKFDNYYETMAFVNAIAFMAHKENHHPDLEVGYNHCKVLYTTHAVNGLTENDMICANKINQILNS